MAEEKRYFWLRLYDDFFTSKRIKKLRKIAGGDTYVIIYLKMQLIAMKHGGTLKWSGLEEKFADELALDLDEDPANVAVTLQYLLSCRLAEASDDLTEVFLPYAVKNVGSEGAAAQRMRAHRARKNNALSAPERNNVTTSFELCYGEIESESEIESETEKSIPPLPPKGEMTRPQHEPLPCDVFSEDLAKSVEEWLTYKWERNKAQYYKQTGYKNLIAQIKNNAEQYGEKALQEVIAGSIANNYQGICWERLKKGYARPKATYEHEDMAYRAAKYFADEKAKDQPDAAHPTEGQLQGWADAMHKLNEENGVSWKIMSQVMVYALDSPYWSVKVQSPYDLKRDFNKIFAELKKEEKR